MEKILKIYMLRFFSWQSLNISFKIVIISMNIKGQIQIYLNIWTNNTKVKLFFLPNIFIPSFNLHNNPRLLFLKCCFFMLYPGSLLPARLHPVSTVSHSPVIPAFYFNSVIFAAGIIHLSQNYTHCIKCIFGFFLLSSAKASLG